LDWARIPFNAFFFLCCCCSFFLESFEVDGAGAVESCWPQPEEAWRMGIGDETAPPVAVGAPSHA
jgi:hypothetical protein